MPSISSLSALLLLPTAILASYDCSHVRVDGQSFNLKALGGPKDVHWARHRVGHTPPTVANTTFTFDICKALTYGKDVSKNEKCPGGTRVCGIERDYSSEIKNGEIREVIPVAGDYATSEGRRLDPQFTRIKGGKSNDDQEQQKEGVIMELHGGYYAEKKQQTVINFLCDKELEGTEGFEDTTKSISEADATFYGSMGTRDAADDGDEDDSPLPDLDQGKAVQFVSYKDEDNVGVLRLNWKTKFACEGFSDKAPDSRKNTSGWGFFTWTFIILALLAACYIIFGSWLNYNRYGARGWDLIPHGDAIRDIPYFAKELSASVVDKIKGGGSSSRGGYSAV